MTIPWQFSVLTKCVWPIRWQFPSPHRNHSGHRYYTLIIIILFITVTTYRSTLQTLQQQPLTQDSNNNQV